MKTNLKVNVTNIQIEIFTLIVLRVGVWDWGWGVDREFVFREL